MTAAACSCMILCWHCLGDTKCHLLNWGSLRLGSRRFVSANMVACRANGAAVIVTTACDSLIGRRSLQGRTFTSALI